MISPIKLHNIDYLEDKSKAHERPYHHKEAVEPKVVLRTDAISYPRAVMIIHADASFADLAMARSIWLYKLI